MRNVATTMGSRVNDTQIRCTEVLSTQKRERPAKIDMS
jgi:hypothetical protein